MAGPAEILMMWKMKLTLFFYCNQCKIPYDDKPHILAYGFFSVDPTFGLLLP